MLSLEIKNRIEFIKKEIRKIYENNDSMFLPTEREQTKLIKSLLHENHIAIIKSKVKDYMVKNCTL